MVRPPWLQGPAESVCLGKVGKVLYLRVHLGYI